MNNPTMNVAVQSAETGEPVNAPALAGPEQSAGQAEPNKIPLMVRTRKVVRLAPPIDDGFRPFRVF